MCTRVAINYKVTVLLVHGQTVVIRVQTLAHCEEPFGLEENLVGWVSAIVPAAILIAISTWPSSTSPARFLNPMNYRGPKGRLRQNRVVKVDCALHMLVTTPLPEFINSPVKECRVIATRKSTRSSYEEFSEEEE